MTRVLRTAEIIAVGTELLTPFRTDTNSLFLTERLNDLGLVVHAKAVVGDDARDLGGVLRAALARADVVVLTGGLGPTHDDLTRDVVSEVLDRPLQENLEVLAEIQSRFIRRGVPMPAINRKQALVLKDSIVLPNGRGTAPGLFVHAGDRVVVLLPGPPREMQPMFDDLVAPRLGAFVETGRFLRRRVLKITGRSESQVAEVAYPVYSNLSVANVGVGTSILAAPGQIELHLEATGTDAQHLDRVLDDGVARLVAALGAVVFSTDGRSLEAVVGDSLRSRGLRVAVAESCTGGLLLSRLTDVPGASVWVVGGVVAYDNATKVDVLAVPEDLIAAHGAVSGPVARAMASGVQQRLRADVGIGITGIAGPGGGSEEKPVGTVFVAVAGPAEAVWRFQFAGDRETVRRHATAAGLDMVRRGVLGLPLER
jgi:nicotinamide-nucleotide amidase